MTVFFAFAVQFFVFHLLFLLLNLTSTAVRLWAHFSLRFLIDIL